MAPSPTSKSKKGINALQGTLKSKSQCVGDLKVSKKDRSVKASMNQFKNLFFLRDNVSVLLEEMTLKLKSNDPSKTISKQFVKQMTSQVHSLSVVVKEIASTMIASVKITSPFPEMLTAFERQEVLLNRSQRNKHSVKLTRHTGSVSEMKVKERFNEIKASGTINNTANMRKLTKVQNKRSMLKPKDVLKKYHVPVPANGNMYNPKETFEILHSVQTKHGNKARISVIDHMISENLVGVRSQRSLYRLYKKPTQDLCPDTWNEVGRPRLVSHEALLDIVTNKTKGSSTTLSSADLTTIIDNGKVQRAKLNGKILSGDQAKASSMTYKRYALDIAIAGITAGTLSICENDNVTTQLRATAGNSLRSMTSYVIGVCNSHFLIGEAPSNSAFSKLKDKLGQGSKKTISMVEDALNVSVYPIPPDNVLSTDDTTEYIFEGKRTSNDPWRIVSAQANGTRGHKSLNHVDAESSRFGGFRVKVTVTMSGGGSIARLVVVVSSLSDEELVMDENEVKAHRGMCVMKVQGLSMHASMNPTSTDYGYIIFTRKNCKTEEARHIFYDEHVLQEFVSSIEQKNRLVSGIPKDAPRSYEDTVVSWRDGDIAQINALINSDRLKQSEKQYVTYMKQSASRSKDEQAADLSPVFKVIHQLNKKYTSVGKPKTFTQILLESQLKNDERVNLKTENQKALLDFVSQLGSIMIKAATATNVKAGFFHNGMLDVETETCPDMDKMMGTLTRPLTLRESQLFHDNFTRLMNTFQEYGYIPEEVYDDLGFTDDLDGSGNIVNRYSSVDFKKRAFQLNHKSCNEKRKELVLEGRKKMFDKEIMKYNKIQDLLLQNKAAEDKIKQKSGALALRCASLLDFNVCKADELKSFIFARSLKSLDHEERNAYFERMNVTKLPNRLKLSNALAGENCLLLWAFNLRGQRLSLEIPERPVLDIDSCVHNWDGPLMIDVSYESNEKSYKPAIEYIISESWRKMATKILDSSGFRETNYVSRIIGDDESKACGKLEKMLFQRLPEHIAAKVTDKSKSSFVWDFVKENLGPVSALMILMGHVKKYEVLQFCHGNDRCLLRDPTGENKFMLGHPIKDLEGCYLYWHTSSNRFVRSGKVSGGIKGNGSDRTFQTRHREHEKGSELKSSKSKESLFYNKYPSRSGLNEAREPFGLFEELIQYEGFGFERRVIGTTHCLTDEKNGLFSWSKTTIKKISNCGTITGIPLQDAKLDMVAYLFELCYDLCLAKVDNVSRSPGFEKYLGQFGHGRDEF